MAITIEQLDDECIKKNVSILTGYNFVIKFIPGISILNSNRVLTDLINTQDLLNSQLIYQVKKSKTFSEKITQQLTKSIEFRETLKKMKGKEYEVFYRIFKEIQDDVVLVGKKIIGLEKAMGLYLAQNNNLYFCNKCGTYLADSPDTLPEECSLCHEKTEWEKYIKTIRFLDTKTISYINGPWFEDYVAKLLEKIGWKTWTHGSVMGSSGVDYQIDVLAINPVNGRVIIGECKTGDVAKEHVFYLSAQYHDIKSTYGFMFSYKAVVKTRLVNYMERTAGLCLLDNLQDADDETIIKKVGEHLKIL